MEIYGIKTDATGLIKENLEKIFNNGSFRNGDVIMVDEDYRFAAIGDVLDLAKALADAAEDSTFLFRGKLFSDTVNEYQVFEAEYEDNVLSFRATEWLSLEEFVDYPAYEDEDEDYEDNDDFYGQKDQDFNEEEEDLNFFDQKNNDYFAEMDWFDEWTYEPGEEA